MGDMSDGKRREATLLTPPGRGGVAVILIADPTGKWLQSHFRSRGRKDPSPDRMRSGWITRGSESIEEGLVREWEDGPAEIQCHGGTAVADRILDLTKEEGFIRVSPQEGIHRRSGGDPIRKEALSLLIEAETDAGARMLAAQAGGALSSRLEEILDLDRGPALEAIDLLLRTASYGIALTAPVELWIMGPPNAGKSTLFNTLIGWDRTIVHEGPGTTRDHVRERTAIGGIPVTLVDTPGLREGETAAEAIAIERTEAGWDEARRAIFCIDGSRPPEDAERIRRLDPERQLLALTKSDLPSQVSDLHGQEAIPISALTGHGIDRLREAIRQRLVPDGVPDPRGPVVFTERQRALLQSARGAISAGKLDLARLEVRQCQSAGDNGDLDD